MLKFRVLGPDELIPDSDLIAVDGSTTLSWLAGLLTTPSRVISGQTIVGWIWDTRLLRHPRAAMHNGISRLRKLVGGDRIEALTWGYRLHADALAVYDRLRRDLNDELGIRVKILCADLGLGVAARRTKQSPVTGQVR